MTYSGTDPGHLIIKSQKKAFILGFGKIPAKRI
jgi:hypothetical protein